MLATQKRCALKKVMLLCQLGREGCTESPDTCRALHTVQARALRISASHTVYLLGKYVRAQLA